MSVRKHETDGSGGEPPSKRQKRSNNGICLLQGKVADYDTCVKEAAKLIKRGQRVVGLTGAGVSTDSGIPDFRGDGFSAIWKRYDPEDFYLDVIADVEEPDIRRDYWRLHTEMYERFLEAKPNVAHRFFASLHKAGHLSLLVTQNIDGLHSSAGVPTESIVELHGNALGCSCWECHEAVDRLALHKALVEGSEIAPVCRKRDCPGVVKPHVVDFGQRLDGHLQDRAEAAVRAGDLFLCMGTSLTVAPANRMPDIAVATKVPVIIVNLSSTRSDSSASVCIRAPLDTALPDIQLAMTRLDKELGPDEKDVRDEDEPKDLEECVE